LIAEGEAMRRVVPKNRLLRLFIRGLAVVALVAMPLLAAEADDATPGPAAPAPAPGTPAAGAATPDTSPTAPIDIVAFILSQEHHKAVIEAARDHNSKLPDGCKTAALLWGGMYQQLAKVHFDAAGQLKEGAWRETVIAYGCNSQRLFNLLTLPAPGGGARVVSLLPGTTAADAFLQRDTLPDLLSNPAFGGKDCAQRLVTDTIFGGSQGPLLPTPYPNVVDRAWHETWIVWACGKTYEAPVDFNPVAKPRFTIEVDGIKER
jgi:hypothetical protein